MTESYNRVPNPADGLLSQMMLLALPYVEQYQANKISEKSLIKALRPILYQEYGRILQLEKKFVAEIDRELGMQSQTTDSSGAHNMAWFEQTGLSYATGLATSAIAIAITHPEVGMSAVQRNLVTPENVIQLIASAAKSKFAQGMIETATNGSLGRMTTSTDSLNGTVQKAVTEAMSAFSKLSPTGVPLQGTQLSVVGGDFLAPTQISSLSSLIQQTVSVHPAMHDGRARLLGRKITFANQLGSTEPTGILWGGPRHALYPQPVFYTRGNLT